jgi:alpha-beta hydrolase superfamily lysophospholipase
VGASRPMKLRHAWRPLLLAALVAAGGVAGCTSFDEQQRRWIFQPSKDAWWGGMQAAEGMQDVWIPFESKASEAPVRLHALWLPQAGKPDAPVLLYLHGARWDVRGSASRLRRMHDLGFAVLGIDYRGFGRSTDALPSETLAVEDARAAWDWLGREHPGRARFIFGHSLGGAIAVELAAQVGPQAAGLMVEGTFTSIRDVFGAMKWGWLPVGPFITQRFDAAERIAKVSAPVLVVHGSEDRIVPQALGRALYERVAAPRKRFVLVEGGSHHNTNALAQDAYREALASLFGLGA